MHKIGFDAEKYIEEQSKYILERINHGNSERLYLEFGGKLVHDKHAMRVLPGFDENAKIKTLSKGTREKVQLILVMSRDADLFVLDEPIAGVDPAARDYIIRTIITNYNENATVLLSTHLISDIENILDEVVFLKEGNLVLQATVEEIREQKGKSVDAYFREVFACC